MAAFWLDLPDSGSGSGVDRLWLRQPGLDMADILLPGITNTTSRARYFSMIGWMFANAENSGELRTLENAFLQAVRHHGEQVGHSVMGVGSSKVLDALGVGALQLPEGFKAPSVLVPAQYAPAAAALGIGSRSAGLRGPIAAELAAALALPPEATPAADAKVLRPDQLEALSRMCLCTRPSGQERAILVDLLFRTERRRRDSELERGDSARRTSLALMLEHLDGRSTVDTEAAFLQWALAHALGRSVAPPSPALALNAWGYGVLGARFFMRHALESLWAGFGRLLRDPLPGTTVAPYTGLVLGEADAVEPDLAEAQVTLDALHDSLDHGPTEYLDRYVAIEAELLVQPERAMLRACTQLSSLCRAVPQLRTQPHEMRELLDRGGVERVSLAFLADSEARTETVEQWVWLLLERFVVAQHLLAASFKLATGSQAYNFRVGAETFILTDDKPWNPDPGPTKLGSALSMLAELGLLEEVEHEWRRTAAGDRVLAQVLADPGTWADVPNELAPG